MKEWIEYIIQLGEKAKKEYDERDFVDLCIIGRKMAEHLNMLLEKEHIDLDITDIWDFFSKYNGEEDLFKPLLASQWGGLPDSKTGEECMSFINKILSITERLR